MKGLPAKIIDTSAGGLDSGEIQWKCEKAGERVRENTTVIQLKYIWASVCSQLTEYISFTQPKS